MLLLEMVVRLLQVLVLVFPQLLKLLVRRVLDLINLTRLVLRGHIVHRYLEIYSIIYCKVFIINIATSYLI